MILVRQAREDDMDAMVQVYHDAWHSTYPRFMPPAAVEARTLESFRPRLSDSLPHVRLAEVDGDIAALVHRKGSRVFKLWVAPPYQKQGLGRALLEDAWKAMRAEGQRLTTLACIADNTTAKAFYEHLGYESMGEITDEVADGTAMPIVIFRKMLVENTKGA